MRAKRIFCMLLALSLILGLFSIGAGAAGTQFTDVKEGDWFYEAVSYVCGEGLMNGTGGGKFSPYDPTTRGMIVTILHRIEGTPEAKGDEFSDVPPGQYYSAAVSWASANEIVGGYGNGRFGPNDNITREQMATILYRYVLYKGYDSSPQGDCSAFADGDKVSSYAREAMNWAIGAGIISGVGDNRLDPSGTANRAQAATILMRFCINIADAQNGGLISFYSDTIEIFSGESVNVSFFAELSAAAAGSLDSIPVYRDGKQVCTLFDDGSNSDDIAGDNIFSGSLLLGVKAEGELVFTARAGEQELSCSIYVSGGLTAQELEPYNNIVDSIEAQVAPEQSVEQQIDEVAALAEKYMESGLVVSYSENEFGVLMTFDNGIGYVYMPEIEGLEEGRSSDESYPEIESFSYSGGSDVGGKSVLAIRPFLSADSIGASLNEGLKDFADYGYSVQFMDDQSVTISGLKTMLKGHDIIIWRGHGGNWIDNYTDADEGIILSVSEKRTNYKDQVTYASDLVNGRVLWASGDKYVFNANFINYYYQVGDFEDSFVYLGACHPLDAAALYSAFLSRGARTVVGVVNSIQSDYNEAFTRTFFQKLSLLDSSGSKTLSASEALALAKAKHGSSDGRGGHHVLKGLGDYVIFDASKQAENLSFELGKSGWNSYGDFRILTGVGSLRPTHGSYMALVGTGLGSGDDDTLITSSFFGNMIVSSGQKLYIDFDFVSEEPLEWIGTGYDDTMQFIIHVGSKKYVIYENSIDSASWKYLGGNYFYGGDDSTYHTGWSTFGFDLSSIAGIGSDTLITLEVKIYDVGDSIYDSVVLVDNIRLG